MDWADLKGVNYDWWNCHEFYNDDGSTFYEIGMNERDWDAYVTYCQQSTQGDRPRRLDVSTYAVRVYVFLIFSHVYR